jgi:hypothetical protein
MKHGVGIFLVGAGCLCLFGCAALPPPLEVPDGSGVSVSPARALSFQRRADGFYLRLEGRRFNTLETFNDFILRDHFETLDLFYDYYADLAQSLQGARFEKSRPDSIEVEDFAFDNPRSVRVKVRFGGSDGRPLHPGSTALVRIDHWEWIGGTWWIRPGKV